MSVYFSMKFREEALKKKEKTAKQSKAKKMINTVYFFLPLILSRRQPRVIDASDDLVEDTALHPVDGQLVHPIHAPDV